MNETTTGSGEVNKEDLVNNPSSLSTSNPHNATKSNEHKLEKGGEAENQDSSQNYQGQFIPTCISPYQQNPSAFALYDEQNTKTNDKTIDMDESENQE